MLSGALGLQILVRRLGVELGEQQFAFVDGYDSRELTSKEIKEISKKHSIVCRGVKTDLNGLAEAVKKQPVLAHLKNGRYVIVVKIGVEGTDISTINVIDPSVTTPKPEKVDPEQFGEFWSGFGLIFKKSRRLERADGEATLGAVFDDIIDDKWMVSQLVIIIAFINLFALAPTIFLMIVLDKVVGYQSYSTLYVITSGVVIAHVFNFILSFYKTSIIGLAAAKIEAKYGMQIFRNTIDLPLPTFEKQSSQFSGLGRSFNNIRTSIISKLLGVINDFLAVLIFTPILIFYSPIIGFIAVGMSLFTSIVGMLHDRRNLSISSALNKTSAKRQDTLDMVGRGFIDIKRLGLENDVVQEWREVEGEFLKATHKNSASQALMNEFGSLMNNLLTVIVLFVGVHLVFSGSLSAGVLVGANMLIGKIFRPTQTLFRFPQEMKNLNNQLKSVGSTTILSTENLSSGNYASIIGAVKFDKVSLEIDGDRNVLRNLSFSIDVNDVIGICSPVQETSNAIVQLIQGLNKPANGSIIIDGNDITSFNLQHLRTNVALVDPTSHFFTGTIRDNFQRVLPGANNDRIEWASEMAGLNISLSKFGVTMDTDIDDIRNRWDDSFRIRLALARALIRNPKILLLNDITSHLDNESLLHFKENFSSLIKSRTVIVIAKNIYDLTECRKLMYLEDSTLKQFGPTWEILTSDGPARSYLKKQLRLISPQFEKMSSSVVEKV